MSVAAKKNIRLIVAMTLSMVSTSTPVEAASRAPMKIIFDTDMYTDIDDMLALAMLNTLADRREVKLLGVTVETEGPSIAPYISLVDTFYGHGDVPIGMVRNGITADYFDRNPIMTPPPYAPDGINYTRHIAEERDSHGFVFPRRTKLGAFPEDATRVLRRALAAQADDSVVIVAVGYETNLARLLESKSDRFSALDGKALVARKVHLLAVMGGSFGGAVYHGQLIPGGGPEFNFKMDVPSARRVFADWPSPIIASGAEVGIQAEFPQSAIDRYFNYTAHHPIAETYRYVAPSYGVTLGRPGQPHDHPTWDLMPLLYAVRPDAGYFALSDPGTVSIGDGGETAFATSSGGRVRFLTLLPALRARVVEAMVALVSEPPTRIADRPRSPCGRDGQPSPPEATRPLGRRASSHEGRRRRCGVRSG